MLQETKAGLHDTVTWQLCMHTYTPSDPGLCACTSATY